MPFLTGNIPHLSGLRTGTESLKMSNPVAGLLGYWKTVKMLENNFPSKTIVLKDINNFIYSPKLVANRLALDFANRSSEIIPNAFVPNIIMDVAYPFLIEPQNYNSDFNLTELIRACNAGTGKCPGPDNIPPQIYKNLSKPHLFDLLNIINYFWKTNIPQQWKKSYVIPIRKPNKNPTLPSSYRPIALTNTISKIMERMVNHRLKKFLSDKNILDPKQSGFRSGFSSLDGVARLEAEIRQNHKNSKPTLAVYIDFQQAFDSVQHKTIIHELKTQYTRKSTKLYRRLSFKQAHNGKTPPYSIQCHTHPCRSSPRGCSLSNTL